jgi:hypothetical protein
VRASLSLRGEAWVDGPMQVYGKGKLTLEKRLAFSRLYIEHLSVSQDFRLSSAGLIVTRLLAWRC